MRSNKLFELYRYSSENTLEEQCIEEALIHTYDSIPVINHLVGTFPLAKGFLDFMSSKDCVGWVEMREGKNDSEVILLVLDLEHSGYLKDITLSMEKSCGWFLSTSINIGIDGLVGWQFEKKFDNNVTKEVLSLTTLYHLAPTSRLKKILNVGLLPKKTTWKPFMLDDEHTFTDEKGNHCGWKTIDRVYFFKSKPSVEFLKNNRFSSKEIFTDTYSLLKIDVSQLLPETNFYSGPRSANAVYTLNNIPPRAITVDNKTTYE